MELKDIIGKTVAKVEQMTLGDDESQRQDLIRLEFSDGTKLELESCDADGFNSWIEVRLQESEEMRRLKVVERWVSNREEYEEEMRERMDP